MISESTKLFLVEGGGGGALVFSFGGCGAFRFFLDFFGLETTLKNSLDNLCSVFFRKKL